MSQLSSNSMPGNVRHGRPGILTAIGPISIVVASLALLGGLIGGCSSWMTVKVVGETNNRAKSYVRSMIEGQSATRPAESQEAYEVRLAAASRRAAVVDALAELQTLPGSGKLHLDRLLSQHGDDILPPSIRHAEKAAASTLGQLALDQGRSESAVWFVFPTGRLTVTADDARFVASSGDRRTLDSKSVVAPVQPAADPFATPAEVEKLADPEAAAPQVLKTPLRMRHPSGLTTGQINSIIAQVQKRSKDALTPSQQSSLALELQNGTQSLVPPSRAYAAVREVRVDSDGEVFVWLVDGAITINANGVVVDRMGTSIQNVTVTPLAVSPVVADTVVGIALAVLLLVAAIMLIRRSPWAIAAHRLYAVLKIPAMVLGLVGYRWVPADFDTGVSKLNRTVGSSMQDSFGTFWQVMIGLGGLHAVVLLIILATRPVRDYERSPGD